MDNEEKRIKTIYWLNEEVKRAEYIDTDYLDCVDVNVLRDALELLKVQDNNDLIITEKDLDDYIDSYDGIARVWIQQKSIYPDRNYLFATSLQKRNHRRPEDKNFYCLEYEYYLERNAIGKFWVVWKNKPTDDQRKAVKWRG